MTYHDGSRVQYVHSLSITSDHSLVLQFLFCLFLHENNKFALPLLLADMNTYQERFQQCRSFRSHEVPCGKYKGDHLWQ